VSVFISDVTKLISDKRGAEIFLLLTLWCFRCRSELPFRSDNLASH
jgi:hypothetical protein